MLETFVDIFLKYFLLCNYSNHGYLEGYGAAKLLLQLNVFFGINLKVVKYTYKKKIVENMCSYFYFLRNMLSSLA